MPRITISIPDDLKRQLSDSRVRQALNVSRVCQAALRREVRRLLDLPLDLARLEQLLARLGTERNQLRDRSFALGSAAARDWVEAQASYEQLAQLGPLPLERRLAGLRAEPPVRLRQLLQQHQAEEGFDQASFEQGWAVALGLLWDVIERNL